MTTRTVGDTAPAITGTINAATVGASGVVNLERADGSVVTRVPVLTDDGDGTSSWSLDLIAGDLTVPGLYFVELEVTFSSGKVQTFALGPDGKAVTFIVRKQIA